MRSEDYYFKTLNKAELWQRYCGFFDLSMEGFMKIQKELLMEEMNLVCDSFLGKKIMGNRRPRSVEEFRSIVPLTTYDDYEPYLSERQENALAVKPCLWCHSSGKGGSFKWVPHSAEIVDEAVRSYLAGAILASCRKKGEVRIAPGARILCILAPSPYASGALMLAFAERFSLRVMPPLETAETAAFQDRIKQGFKMALKEGVDFMGSLSSVLVRVGEEFTEQAGGIKISAFMLHPKVALRLLRAWLRAKIERRAILPKDIWQPKGILVSGVDTAIYKHDVAYYWGVMPLELYGGTEAHTYALESWTRKGMVFLPDRVFLEFIPYEQVLKLQDDKHYQPSTVLLDEVEEGELYEVVVTQYYGMPLLRYRLNDVIRVIATKDEEAGINLPQIAFQRRVSEVINLAGLVWLDEKTVWQALFNTGVKFVEWCACKEYDSNQTFLRLHVELKEERDADEVANLVDAQLRLVDTNYWELHSTLNLKPVKVTLLSPGTFQRFTEEKIKEGADLAHLKPAHMNPPEPLIQRLRNLSEMSSGK